MTTTITKKVNWTNSKEVCAMLSINDMVTALIANKAIILKTQADYEAALSDKDRNRYSRNKRPHGGWTVPGIAAYTKAVKAANMPWDYFWSGSLPTPSTQYPKAVYDFLVALNKKED